jgi:hypothetical protein
MQQLDSLQGSLAHESGSCPGWLCCQRNSGSADASYSTAQTLAPLVVCLLLKYLNQESRLSSDMCCRRSADSLQACALPGGAYPWRWHVAAGHGGISLHLHQH